MVVDPADSAVAPRDAGDQGDQGDRVAPSDARPVMFDRPVTPPDVAILSDAAPTPDAGSGADAPFVGADVPPVMLRDAGDGGPSSTLEICNGLDDDADGMVDEDCPCVPDTRQVCFPGPGGLAGVGPCRAGMQRCLGNGEFGTWGPCEGAIGPSPDVCSNNLDEDCNGTPDDGTGCLCTAGMTRSCYPRDRAEVGRGICRAGTQICIPGGSAFSECTGAVTPTTEVCGNNIDEDCNGTADDWAGCMCTPGAMEPCYPGPMGTAGVGICAPGNRVCAADGRSWGGCNGAVLPRMELCANSLDDDCDGTVDNGPTCVCTAGATRSCYPGPAAEVNRGRCRAGTQRCVGGTMYTACAGAVGPVTEVCGNSVDDDCDGMTDEGCSCLSAGSTPWQQVLDPAIICYGRDLDEDPREFNFARIPGETDSRWRGRATLTIDFSDPSTIPSRFCDGSHTGGVFSYFQTFVTIPTGAVPRNVTVAIDGVDDATQVRVYNSRFPSGYTESGWIRFDGGSTSNIANALVVGRNRVLLIHIDDNPTRRELRNVRLLFDGRALTMCR